MIFLAILCGILAAGLVASQLLHGWELADLTQQHQKQVEHLVAALMARTPGEYAGLVAASNIGSRERPAPPKRKPLVTEDGDELPEGTHPIGL